MAFPQAVSQCPIYYNHLNTAKPKPQAEDDRHIPYHSNYIDCGNLPLYSFGHGLSYSNFCYENMTLSKDRFRKNEKVTVKVTIYNGSDVGGKETVMLYMRDLFASNSRPVQQLIAFEKVEFGARERKTVEFEIDETMLSFGITNTNLSVKQANFIFQQAMPTICCLQHRSFLNRKNIRL